jgi:hypothetical protein
VQWSVKNRRRAVFENLALPISEKNNERKPVFVVFLTNLQTLGFIPTRNPLEKDKNGKHDYEKNSILGAYLGQLTFGSTSFACSNASWMGHGYFDWGWFYTEGANTQNRDECPRGCDGGVATG